MAEKAPGSGRGTAIYPRQPPLKPILLQDHAGYYAAARLRLPGGQTGTALSVHAPTDTKLIGSSLTRYLRPVFDSLVRRGSEGSTRRKQVMRTVDTTDVGVRQRHLGRVSAGEGRSEMFGRKLEPQGPSAMGGRTVEAATTSTMVIEDHAAPFIAGGAVTDTWPLGVIEGRCLGTGATHAFVAATAAATRRSLAWLGFDPDADAS